MIFSNFYFSLLSVSLLKIPLVNSFSKRLFSLQKSFPLLVRRKDQFVPRSPVTATFKRMLAAASDFQVGEGCFPASLSQNSENGKSDGDVGSDDGKITMEIVSSETIISRKHRMEINHMCQKCFLTKIYCLCDYNQKLFQPVQDEIDGNHSLNVHFHLFTHYKEWGRASNTGKLLSTGLPDSTSVPIFGNSVDQEKMIDQLSNSPSFVLYPSSESRCIDEFQELFYNTTVIEKKPFHICVIDSTWSQSRAMEKVFPSTIPRVHISNYVNKPSKFLNRKQSTNPSKISTIESLTMALDALKVSPFVLEIFHKSLEYGVDSLLRQGGKSAAYGNTIKPRILIANPSSEGCNEEEPKYFGPITSPAVLKPEKCLCCGSKYERVNFKNCGIRIRERELASRTPEQEEEEAQKLAPLLAAAENYKGNVSDLEFQENMSKWKKYWLYSSSYRVWKCSECFQYFPGEFEGDTKSRQKEI
jgi:DTW domain-containing protein YfiP